MGKDSSTKFFDWLDRSHIDQIVPLFANDAGAKAIFSICENRWLLKPSAPKELAIEFDQVGKSLVLRGSTVGDFCTIWAFANTSVWNVYMDIARLDQDEEWKPLDDFLDNTRQLETLSECFSICERRGLLNAFSFNSDITAIAYFWLGNECPRSER